MVSINFNWNVYKMVSNKAYDFTLNNDAKTCKRDGDFFECEGARVAIFRKGASVLDMLGATLRVSGVLTSGEVYKANLLRWFNEDYESAQIFASGIDYPSYTPYHNKPKKESAYFYGFELEVLERNRDCFKALSAIESNIIRKVSDVSIGRGQVGEGIEFVSGAFLHPSDAINPSFYEPFCDMITGLAKSKTIETTGLHFHVSREAFGATTSEQMENIAKCIYIENYLLNDASLERVFGRGTNREWARRNETRTTFVNDLANVCRVVGGRIMNDESVRVKMVEELTQGNAIRVGHNYPQERYQRVNITNPHTIEFRQGKGDINSKSLARIAQHIDTLIKYASTAKWASLSQDGYLRSIPRSAKYDILRDCFTLND